MISRLKLPQLSSRDRFALILGGAVVLITILVMGVILPYQSALASLDKQIRDRRRQVTEVQAMRQEYLLLQQRINAAEQRLNKSQGFSVFSFVEGLVTQVATRENLVYMRPQPPSVQEGIREEAAEIKLERIRLDQLIQFLYSVESAEAHLQVKNLRVKTRFDDRTLLDAVMTLSSYGRSA